MKACAGGGGGCDRGYAERHPADQLMCIARTHTHNYTRLPEHSVSGQDTRLADSAATLS